MPLRFKKILKWVLISIGIFLFLFLGYLFFGESKPAKKITWGVNFSQEHTKYLGLDWKETYLALLDDLKVKNIKLITYWNLIEPRGEEYHFEDLDWQIKQAELNNVKILLVIGMKTGRWPECHEPDWIKNQKPKIRNQKLLEYLKEVVNRYKNSEAIWAWQVENEPLFYFGKCPKIKKDFLKREVELVKSLDPQKRPIVISDSGEGSLWIAAARIGDIVGTTMYKRVWFTLPNFLKKNLGGFRQGGFYVHYPFPPVFYWRKARYIKEIFDKKVIVVELQAEPWGPRLLYDLPVEEQKKTMNLEQFKKNIKFAKNTGLDKFYLWGAEWWYWMKEVQNDPSIWNEAKKLF